MISVAGSFSGASLARTAPGACLALALLTLGLSSPASATLFCEVAETQEGFAALRTEPSDAGTILERMAPGDEVRLAQGDTGEWLEVAFWPAGRFASGAVAGDDAAIVGWMRARDLVPDSCG